MKIKDFCRELKGLGFTGLEQNDDFGNLYVKFYEAPERLADTIEGISLEGCREKNGAITDYRVTFQAAEELDEKPPVRIHRFSIETKEGAVEVRKLGWSLSAFCVPADKHLLNALRRNGKNLLDWLFSPRCVTRVCVRTLKVNVPETGETINEVIFGDGVVPMNPARAN
jgi:hypothetical protein